MWWNKVFVHMMPNDIPVFASFLFTPDGQKFTAWEFDVLVGNPRDPGPHYPMAQRKAALYQNSLKIDAVGWLFESPTLIECKPRCNLSAIGQVLVYQRWYEIIFQKKPSMMIVAESISDQVQTYCDLEDIAVRIVPPASDYLIQQAMDYIQPMVQQKSILPQYQAVS